MSLTVKVYYEWANAPAEIRRFPVDSREADFFTITKEKVKQLYPSLCHGNFAMYWTDSDGERIIFSSLEEMREAIANSKDGILRIYIPEPTAQQKSPSPPRQQPEPPRQQQPDPPKTSEPPKTSPGEKAQPEGPIHYGITCDGCEGPVIGVRFKCCVCPDYDLCQTCEGKGLHANHNMYKITTPRKPQMGGFFPPHLNRYLQRCMRNMSMETGGGPGFPAGCPTGAEAEAPPESSAEDKEKNKANYEEWLNNVGANIAAFLDPLGIDVTYDVHHDGDRPFHHHHAYRGGCHGGWGRRNCPAWEGMSQRAQQDAAKGPCCTPGPQQMETDSGETLHRDPNQPIPMPDASKAPSDHSDDEWTHVASAPFVIPGSAPIPMPAPTTVNSSAPPPAANTEANLYPNLNLDIKIQQSLDQMLSMGFSNNDNWLTNLLIEHRGDIGLTLDAIKAKATHQLNSLSYASETR